MRELSLFSGAGGGLLATKHLLGWETKGYVENDEYCQRVLKARIGDGLLDSAPIFGDIRAFITDGYASAYSGMVDIVTGGDPCQANSCAAPKGSPAPSLGGEFIECVKIIRPRFVFRENPSVVRHNASWSSACFKSALESLGYTVLPVRARSCCFGADHRRSRLFLLGTSPDTNSEPDLEALEALLSKRALARKAREGVGCGPGGKKPRPPWILSEADVCGIFDAVANRVERCRAIGNGIDPIVAATAWLLLAGD